MNSINEFYSFSINQTKITAFFNVLIVNTISILFLLNDMANYYAKMPYGKIFANMDGSGLLPLSALKSIFS